MYDMYELVRALLDRYKRKRWLNRQKNLFGVSRAILKKAHALGFTGDEYVIYDLEHNDSKNYLSEYERFLFRKYACGNYKILLDNKVVFYSLMRNYAPVNKIYAYKKDGYLHWLEKGMASVKDLLEKEGCLVLKKIASGGGKGFVLLKYYDKKWFINNEDSSLKQIEILLDSNQNYLLEEFCNQSDFENSLFPSAVNTIRIITIEDENGEVKVLKAVQRMGAKKGANVDNASAGGIFADIDLESGRMSAAVCSYSPELLDNKTGNPNVFPIHPVTKMQIEGVCIPNWSSIKKQIIRIHSQIAFTSIPFIAWDIALVENGFKIIEGNTSCGLGLLQRTEGQRYKEMGLLFKRKGII